MDLIQKELLEEIADLHGVPAGAYNIRANGAAAARNTTANIDIVSKEDKPGIDIIIKPGTKKESVHIQRRSFILTRMHIFIWIPYRLKELTAQCVRQKPI